MANINEELEREKGCDKYGADMGRTEHCEDVTEPCHLQRVVIDEGGYDAGGAYWGIPSNLWCAFNDEGTIRVFNRADSREGAERQFSAKYEGIKFLPEELGDFFDAFVAQYIKTALWSSNDESDESGGEPMDRNHDESDIDDATKAKMAEDCKAFLRKAADLIGENPDQTDAAHDFWLTRNGHGAGFWDGDWPENGDKLTAISKEFGTFDLYIGDDEKIHGS